MSEDMRNWRIAIILTGQQPAGKAAKNVKQVSRIQKQQVQTSNGTAKPNSISSVVLGLINESCKSAQVT